jgi:adenylate kinase family enzyme
MDVNIVLIGPSLTGKTTLAKLLGERLNLPVCELDDLRWSYYAEIGYDREYAQQIRQAGGMRALAAYWKPFDIHSVERVLADYSTGHVISFGAGHSVYEDEVFFRRVQLALAPHTVVLVLPSPEFDESVSVLKERVAALGFDPEGDIISLNAEFLKHHSNADLATIKVYTKDKTPDETCDDILAQLKR